MTVEAFAPAKINLTLHVTGQRPDGYHLLDSLVVFADVGDMLSVDLGETACLTVLGPRAAGVPTDRRNLVMKAAEAFGAKADITLTKNLPAAAGIGGGSSDAAAVIRALSDLTGKNFPSEAALRLGADVPVCLAGRASVMAGIGEQVTRVENLPPLPAVLVNPGVDVPTPEVFQALEIKDNSPMMPLLPDPNLTELCQWLARHRNDLEAPARQIEPVIGEVLEALGEATLARMSGSGATCFGIYPDRHAAKKAAEQISESHPEWWVVSTILT